MTIRRAACNCGQLHLTCAGEPVRISTCHCLQCQRRTGAVLSNQAWFERSQVTSIEGHTTQFKRVADSGKSVTFQFCPVCGSTVYLEAEGYPGVLAVAVGSFADPGFSAPKHSVLGETRHRWGAAIGGLPVEHSKLNTPGPS